MVATKSSIIPIVESYFAIDLDLCLCGSWWLASTRTTGRQARNSTDRIPTAENENPLSRQDTVVPWDIQIGVL